MAALKVGSIGDYIREQRSSAQYSLRQLAELAGVSNPYLSQIERGLRKPSAEILQQIAKALRISAETLYVQAGILEEKTDDVSPEVVGVILQDRAITDRQKRVLVEIYESFRKENAVAAEATASKQASDAAVRKAAPKKAAPRKAAPRKAAPKKAATKKTTKPRRPAGE